MPEEWERQQRAASTRNIVIQIAISVVFGGLLLAAAIGGMVAWSRGRYAPRLFLAAAAMVLVASAVNVAQRLADGAGRAQHVGAAGRSS